MRYETLRDAAELEAYRIIEDKYGDVPWRQVWDEFNLIVNRYMSSRKFVREYKENHSKWGDL